MAWVAAVVQGQSLVWVLPHARGIAKKINIIKSSDLVPSPYFTDEAQGEAAIWSKDCFVVMHLVSLGRQTWF